MIKSNQIEIEVEKEEKEEGEEEEEEIISHNLNLMSSFKYVPEVTVYFYWYNFIYVWFTIIKLIIF